MSKRALGLIAALLATSAFATQSGHKWFTVPPTYKVFLHSSINNIPSGYDPNVINAVKTSYARWTSANVSCTSWNVVYGGTYSSPSGVAGVTGGDKVNHTVWIGGSSWTYSSTTLGVTTTSWYSGSGEIFDADMELNNNIPWKLGGTGPYYDVESIASPSGVLHVTLTRRGG